MSNIGSFKKVGNEFRGEINTLELQAQNVRFVPETGRSGENAPSHLIFAGKAEIGVAWAKTSADRRDYHSVKIDDPSLSQPIQANLFADIGGATFSLVWSRPKKSAD
jgi:uncharacterized protein (DUF736 family)